MKGHYKAVKNTSHTPGKEACSRDPEEDQHAEVMKDAPQKAEEGAPRGGCLCATADTSAERCSWWRCWCSTNTQTSKVYTDNQLARNKTWSVTTMGAHLARQPRTTTSVDLENRILTEQSKQQKIQYNFTCMKSQKTENKIYGFSGYSMWLKGATGRAGGWRAHCRGAVGSGRPGWRTGPMRAGAPPPYTAGGTWCVFNKVVALHAPCRCYK